MKLIVIGNPIQHSISPNIHNFWLKKLKINAVYEKRKVTALELKGIVDQIRTGSLKGVNITLPFKEKIIKHVDTCEEVVEASGAANTLFLRENHVVATNTDGEGFVNSLEKDCSFKTKGKIAFIIGTGGAARGIILSLIKRGVREIILMNRSRKRLMKIKQQFKKDSNIILKTQEWNEKIIPNFVDLLVNCTSVGMREGESLDINLTGMKKTAIIYDIVYKKESTQLVKEAKKHGLATQRGHAMLVRQAAESFKIWFDKYPNEEEIIELIRDFGKMT
tara:strand:+ start:74 stop:904 length:831 start_codon:yes stop_codon:yes gene_type:complete